MIDTEILYWRTPEQWKQTLATIPLNRLGSPDDLAETAVFLASSAGNFITGATIDVNGGMLRHNTLLQAINSRSEGNA